MMVIIPCNKGNKEISISEDTNYENSVILKYGFDEISVETSKLIKALLLFEKR